jgi:hypothetical protein
MSSSSTIPSSYNFPYSQVCPGNYAQLLLINARFGNSFWAPAFYTLMPWRDEEAYHHVYQIIADALAMFGYVWPEGLPVMLDFELAERAAWANLFPGHTLEGCMFHMVQNLWKYIQTHGFSSSYNALTPRGKMFKGMCWMTFALPLCPQDRIEEAMELCENEVDNIGSREIEAFCDQYLNYIRNTYTRQFRRENGSHEWNFYHRMGEGHLTNNPSEGANNRLRTRAKTDHPGIYSFGGLLKRELKNSANKLEQYEAGNLEDAESIRVTKNKKTRSQLKSMLENQEIGLRKYLRSQGVNNHQTKERQKRRVPSRPDDPADATRADLRAALRSVTEEDSVDGGAEGGAGGNRRRFATGGGRAAGARGRGRAPAMR